MNFIFQIPTKIIFGADSVEEIGSIMDELGCKRTLVVTDTWLSKNTNFIEKIKKSLGKKSVGVFDKVIQDSSIDIVNQGAEFGRQINADSIVSIGGGSTIDTAKGISILLKEGGKIKDYFGYNMLTKPQTPHVAIPTTAGSGSEVTKYAVIKDRKEKIKIIYGDRYLYPDIAILDSALIVSLPPDLTASIGIDALTHAIEALCSSEAEPISDAFASYAINLTINWLPKCVENGDDIVARGQQLIASTLAGVAFSNAQLGVTHALAHSVGAKFGIPHGVANSILLPHCMRFNLEACEQVFIEIADELGLQKKSGEALIDFIYNFIKKLGLYQQLRDVNAEMEHLEECADIAMADGSIINNPRPITDSDELLEILKSAL